MNVSSHVQFMKGAGARNGRQKRRPDAPHGEGRNGNPGGAVKSINFQGGRDQRTQQLLLNTPVEKEELAPVLMHERQTAGALANRKAIDVHQYEEMKPPINAELRR